VLEAAFWGFVGGAALLVGAGIALVANVPKRVVAATMAFGAGVLISAASFDLTGEAFKVSGADAAGAGLAGGALTFWAASRVIKGSAGVPIVIGAILDGIPESAAIGISLVEGGTVGTAVVVAVFLSNVPESLSATAGLRESNGPGRILALWGVTALVCAVAAAVGFAAMDHAGDNVFGFINAFAAGAIITMLADTMIPEAFEENMRNFATGLLVTLGFALAAFISQAG
jgi:zinc transporter, ZIP family